MAQYLHIVVVALGMTLALVAQVALQLEISDDHQSQPASYQLLVAQSGPASARVSQKQQQQQQHQVANDLYPSLEPNLVPATNGDSSQNNNNNNHDKYYSAHEAVDRPQARERAAPDTTSGRAVINGNHATYVEPPADFRPIIYDSSASSFQQQKKQQQSSSFMNEASPNLSSSGKNGQSPWESPDQLAASVLIPIATNSLSRHQQQQAPAHQIGSQTNQNNLIQQGGRTKYVPAVNYQTLLAASSSSNNNNQITSGDSEQRKPPQRQQADVYGLDSGEGVDSDEERDRDHDEEQLGGGPLPLKPSVGRWSDWHDMSIEPDLASSDTQLAQSSSRGVYHLSPQAAAQRQDSSSDIGKMSATVGGGGGPLAWPSAAAALSPSRLVPYKTRYQPHQLQPRTLDEGTIKDSNYQQVQSAAYPANEPPSGAIKFDDGPEAAQAGGEAIRIFRLTNDLSPPTVRLMPLNAYGYASNLIRLQQQQQQQQQQYQQKPQQQRPAQDYHGQEAQYFGGETQFNRLQQRSSANLLQSQLPRQSASPFYFFSQHPAPPPPPPPPSPMHFLMAHNQDRFASRSQAFADTSESPSLASGGTKSTSLLVDGPARERRPSPASSLKIHQRRSKSKTNAEVRMLQWSAPLKQQQQQQQHSLLQATADFSGAGKQVSAPLISAAGPPPSVTSSGPAPSSSAPAKKATVMHHHSGQHASALDGRVFSLSGPKSSNGASQQSRQPSGGSSSAAAAANRTGSVATQAPAAAKRVLKRRRIKTLLPVGLSSWFLGGIRDLDARHWQLPADLMSKLAVNDVDLQHPADGSNSFVPAQIDANDHEQASPGSSSAHSSSSSIEQAGPALPSSATQRVPNSQLIPR